jgi:hypothetical protein
MSLLKLALVVIPLWGGALALATADPPQQVDAMPNRPPDGGLPRMPDMSVHGEHAGAVVISR